MLSRARSYEEGFHNWKLSLSRIYACEIIFIDLDWILNDYKQKREFNDIYNQKKNLKKYNDNKI